MKKASEEPKQTAKRARKKQSNFGQQQQCEKEAGEAETGAGASNFTSHKVRVTTARKWFPAQQRCLTSRKSLTLL